MERPQTIIDSHVHFAWPITHDSLDEALAVSGADMACLTALAGCTRLDPTLDILVYKHMHPDRVFAFGCLDCTAYGRARGKSLGRTFAKHAAKLMEMGCDGVKMLEGKPTMRKKFPVPDFDSPCWEPFFAYAEETRLPILWHVNDPETFWRPETLPAFARSCGWGYGKDDVDNEAQYRQVRAVLERHPQLNVTFAHMFFFSGQLVRLTEWMDAFPNMRVDLTPGIELYENLSANLEAARAFFDRFPDRILYGTDIGGRTVLKESAPKLNIAESALRAKYCRFFLTESASMGVRAVGDFLIGSEPFVLHGLGLPPDRLDRIFRQNFLAFLGRQAPAPVDAEACRRECARERRRMRAYCLRHGAEPDERALDAADRYFTAVIAARRK